MTDQCRLLLELSDHLSVVVGDLSHALVREHLRMRLGLDDCFRVIGPAGLNGCVACLIKDRRPSVPTVRQQPETMDEYDWCAAARVSGLDLLGDRRGSGLGHHLSS